LSTILTCLTIISFAIAQTDFQPTQGKITASTVNIRNIPSAGGVNIGTLKRSDVVNVIGRSQNKSEIEGKEDYWYKIQFNDGKKTITGWVFGGFISFELNLESGLRWKSATPSPGASLTAISTDTNGNIYAGTSSGDLFISFDYGKSWRKVVPQALGVSIGHIKKIVIDDNMILIASKGDKNGGIWKSTNNGASWSQFTTSQGLPSNEVVDIAIAPNKYIYAITSDKICVSNDGCANWKILDDSGLKGKYNVIAIDRSGIVFVGTNKGAFKMKKLIDVFGKEDTSWIAVGQKSPNMGEVYAIAINPHANEIYVGCNKGLNKSNLDNLDSWQGIGGQSIINDIMIEPDGRTSVATEYGLNISIDNGASWVTYKSENGLSNNYVYRIALHSKNKSIWLITGKDGINYSE